MARVALTVQDTSRTGLNSVSTAEAADAVNGNYFANSSQNVVVLIKNGSGGALTVTFETITTYDSLNMPDLTVSIPNGEERIIGPFDNSKYGQTGNLVNVDYSTGTSVTILAFKLGGV